MSTMKNKEMTVTFSVQGYVKQHVVITDSRITPASLQRGLNTGYYLTTIQEGGEIISRGGKVVGHLVTIHALYLYGLSNKIELEYSDFEVV